MVDSGRKWEPLFFSFCEGPVFIPPASKLRPWRPANFSHHPPLPIESDIMASAAAGGFIADAVVLPAQLRSSISVEHYTLPQRQRASSALPPSSSLLERVGLPLLPASLAPSTIFFLCQNRQSSAVQPPSTPLPEVLPAPPSSFLSSPRESNHLLRMRDQTFAWVFLFAVSLPLAPLVTTHSHHRACNWKHH
ncbi:hypothetical protein VIGAN_09064600 [Vigna angularis var. angularis]|uniref:Uncharacterized protein n=1 Tax=Vigna angularis var. angularis TaxID=157739 RepID=A0A0S3SWD9_PHAAN|nr:hypothetical protein VIGAN_09064600 [Vigna angularis var. angularis]